MSKKSFRRWVDEDYDDDNEDFNDSKYQREDRKRYDPNKRSVQNARRRRNKEKNSYLDD